MSIPKVGLSGNHIGNVMIGDLITVDQSTRDRTATPEAVATLKAVLFAANPRGTTQLAIDREAREIDHKIRLSEHRDRLLFVTAWAVQSDDLLQQLNQHRPQIVHFSGHGTTGCLMLVDSQGESRLVSTAALDALFSTMKDEIRLVFLNACYSRAQAQAIVRNIDFVVGMASTISDGAAIVFAAAFYRALGFGRSVQQAFDQARVALLLDGIPEDRAPVLLVRDGVSSHQSLLD